MPEAPAPMGVEEMVNISKGIVKSLAIGLLNTLAMLKSWYDDILSFMAVNDVVTMAA
jgi:hypothetical protein